MECKYHKTLEHLNTVIWNRIESSPYAYNEYYIGDHSNFPRYYKESFEEILENPLTDEQISLIEKKGENLETTILKWCKKWKQDNPGLQNQQIPESCLKLKIYEYIIYQLNKPDIIAIIGNSC